MRRILLVVRHFPPDASALSYRVRHLAEVLSRDHDVTVVASQPSRYGDSTAAPKRERRDGYAVHRVWNGQLSASRGKLARGAGELLGALWMTWVLLTRYRSADTVLVSSPPVSFLLPGWVLRHLRDIYLVVDVRDLWTDWAEEVELVPFAWMTRLLRSFDRSVVERSDHVTVATRGFKDVLVERYGVPEDRITVVYNGLDALVNPSAKSTESETNGVHAGGDRRVNILYAGNLGPSQNLLAILAGLQKSIAAWDHLEVSIVGDGLQWSALKAGEVERLYVQGRVDRTEIAALYERADAFLLHLADLAVYRHTVPSKIFEYAAYGRPIICGVQGEARALCARYADCYYFDSDDSASLEAAVGRFLSSAPPDNAGVERGARDELARSTRAPVWQSVFSR